MASYHDGEHTLRAKTLNLSQLVKSRKGKQLQRHPPPPSYALSYHKSAQCLTVILLGSPLNRKPKTLNLKP